MLDTVDFLRFWDVRSVPARSNFQTSDRCGGPHSTELNMTKISPIVDRVHTGLARVKKKKSGYQDHDVDATKPHGFFLLASTYESVSVSKIFVYM